MSDKIKVYRFGCSESNKVTDGVFLHGDLIDCNRDSDIPDLCYIPELPDTDGVYPCEVYTIGCVTRECILYLWFTEGWGLDRIKNRGLVVACDDADAIKDAEMKYTERREWL